jgi:hypothetical protein
MAEAGEDTTTVPTSTKETSSRIIGPTEEDRRTTIPHNNPPETTTQASLRITPLRWGTPEDADEVDSPETVPTSISRSRRPDPEEETANTSRGTSSRVIKSRAISRKTSRGKVQTKEDNSISSPTAEIREGSSGIEAEISSPARRTRRRRDLRPGRGAEADSEGTRGVVRSSQAGIGERGEKIPTETRDKMQEADLPDK